MPEVERTETVPIVPRGGPWPVPPLDPDLARLDRGATVGRYVVLGLVGEGGMGVVYAGYDPELDRKVALKVLRPERAVSAAGASDRARLLREAQATARLSHPNVVGVYDAGTFGDQVFIAMEFVDGRTLRDWLEEEPRSWREIVALFRLAGQGLAAAHAAGLVHRDVKPENVLIGKDGRVRVADFGLARPAEPGEAEAAPEAKTGSSPSKVTAWGVVLGTPPYMSPEQLRKGAADARSDQFSFCVALYEALYGERPFAGEEPDEVAGAVERGEIQSPAEAGRVPAWLRQVLLRGLSADPGARHESMDALLRELGRDPGAVRRRWLTAAVLALAGVGLLAWGSALGGAQRVCSGAVQKLNGVWDGARKEAARSAFLSTRLAYAPAAWAGTERSLSSYTESWKTMHREACEATRVRGEQSEDLLDRRMFCLDQRLREVDALVDLFAQADAQVVERSVAAARGLTPLGACADAVALKARVAPPRAPELRARVDQVRTVVARVRALTEAGKHAEAAAQAERAVALARRVGYRPTEAEALFRQAYVQDLLGEVGKAKEAAFEAMVSAQSAGDLALAARSASQLAWTVGYGERQAAEGDRWSRLAFAVAEAMPGDDALHAELLRHRAVIRYVEGRQSEAIETSRRALTLAERAYGSAHPQVASLWSNIGTFLNELGRNEESIQASRRGLEIRRQLLSPDHPDLAKSYNTLGNAYADLRRPDAALDSYRTAYEIFRRRYGMDHPMTPGVLNNIANLDKERRRYAEAEREYLEVLDAYLRLYGSDHPDVAMVLANLGEVRLLQERYPEALATYRRSLAGNEKALGADHPHVASDLVGIGLALLKMGRAEEAVAPLERALRIREAADVSPELLGNSRYDLAQALWESGRNRQQALKLARLARDAYARNESEPEVRSEVEAWLAAREVLAEVAK